LPERSARVVWNQAPWRQAHNVWRTSAALRPTGWYLDDVGASNEPELRRNIRILASKEREYPEHLTDEQRSHRVEGRELASGLVPRPSDRISKVK